jgi:hypothetical protein
MRALSIFKLLNLNFIFLDHHQSNLANAWVCGLISSIRLGTGSVISRGKWAYFRRCKGGVKTPLFHYVGSTRFNYRVQYHSPVVVRCCSAILDCGLLMIQHDTLIVMAIWYASCRTIEPVTVKRKSHLGPLAVACFALTRLFSHWLWLTFIAKKMRQVFELEKRDRNAISDNHYWCKSLRLSPASLSENNWATQYEQGCRSILVWT